MFQSRRPHATATAGVRPDALGSRVAPQSSTQLDEAQALHRLFLTLSHRYEAHCRRTGMPESAPLCEAASRYRQDRSVGALVVFMDRFDELDIPASAGGRTRWS